MLDIKPPYLLFLGSEMQKEFLKTAYGLVEWRRNDCKGQMRLSADVPDLGLPDLDLEQAVRCGIRTLLVGTACIGGGFSADWIVIFARALEAGLDVAAGQHRLLNQDPLLRATAERTGRNLIDVRVPPKDLIVGTGKKRSGRRVLTVGTDCAVGKKYTALALTAELKRRGTKVDFRASGQTGILIAGRGVPIDAVVCDFTAGAAEMLSPPN